MQYAIVSDIHGNLTALDMVIRDAYEKRVDSFIFVGDYCLSNPYPNECINRIRDLHNSYAIWGNEESYLENLNGKDQRNWTDGQMQISYYCYQAVSKENLKYLSALPKELELRYADVELHIAHSSSAFISDCEHKEWSPDKLALRYQNKEITQSGLQRDIMQYFDNSDKFQSITAGLKRGVYIFGHSHIQWSWTSPDEKVILINPGSCGLPLDGIPNSIPYTLLDISDKGDITLTERRIPFSMEDYIEKTILKSEQYVKANVWTKVIQKELKTAREHLAFFLRFTEKYANEIKDARRPYALETWEKAFELWEESLNK